MHGFFYFVCLVGCGFLFKVLLQALSIIEAPFLQAITAFVGVSLCTYPLSQHCNSTSPYQPVWDELSQHLLNCKHISNV